MAEVETQVTLRGGFCIERHPGPFAFVIFGASGDLAHRKLLPALAALFQRRLLPNNFYVLGFSRTLFTNEEFREKIHTGLTAAFPEEEWEGLAEFVRRCSYLQGNYDDPEAYVRLAKRIGELDEENSTGANHIFYLSTPPTLSSEIVCRLGSSGMTRAAEGSYTHVVVEKPFGRDLQSAVALNATLRENLAEEQIYRMDHYLGKDTVQNVLMLRFANAIFEPIWNQKYIDHVEIIVAETVGVEHRAGYFEQAGLLRDIFQNHMIQMLALAASEPPVSFEPNRLRDERVKLIRSIRPFPVGDLDQWIIRGQYGPGRIFDQDVPGYRDEERVAPDSRTETFVAAKLLIDNWRWRGVPFYMRAGKRLARRLSRIAVVFKNVPHSIFAPIAAAELSPNVLVFKVQPEEGVALTIEAKGPGP
ncbi:MAG: glucose-6-phosphate dehydrogenase, partial [Phycisphaerae bacterium]|nr:glucose-6-phosphate dehydrogenase [Phycisphaerae bacterium]